MAYRIWPHALAAGVATLLISCSSGNPQAPTATQSPTLVPPDETATAMASMQTRFTYVPPRVTHGELAVLYLLTAPDSPCAITVTSASGNADLGAPTSQMSDREGNLRIAWRLPMAAPAGPASISVRCDADAVQSSFTVV